MSNSPETDKIIETASSPETLVMMLSYKCAEFERDNGNLRALLSAVARSRYLDGVDWPEVHAFGDTATNDPLHELKRENAKLRDQLDRLLAGETSRA